MEVNSIQYKNRLSWASWLYIACVSAVMITLCSRCSPLYPFNDWVDVNCFFTVGKAMFNGRVVYRDIYEQKGVLLYFIYGIAYLISNTDFFGAYLIEILSFFVFLMMVYDTMCLFGAERTGLLVLPFLAAALCGSRGFYLGGSAEELMLPAIYLPLYTMMKCYRAAGDCIPDGKNMLLMGCGAACLLWSKFTLTGIYIGYIIFGSAVLIKRKEWKKLLHSALCFFAGVMIVSLPWILYFSFNHALADMFEVYFYNNIFVYPMKKTLHNYAAVLTMAFLKNIFMMAFIAFGVYGVLRESKNREFMAGMFCLYFFNVFFVFAGGVAFEYYAYGMAALAVPGAVYAAMRLEAFAVKRSGPAKKVLCAAAAAAFLLGDAAAWLYSDNSFLAKYDREDMWYQKFAEEILASDDHSVLNYNSLDLGIYTLTGYVPQNRFFCKLNINLDEMHNEMDASIREKKTEWVVFTDNTDFPEEYYDIVAEEQSFFSYESAPTTYYLGRKK